MTRTWGRRTDSVARTLEVFSDPWTFVVLRESYFGLRRFEDFARSLDISRDVLTKRLNHLVENGIFERRKYQDKPGRFEYRLTEKGLDMYPVFVTMMRWGDTWLDAGEGPPLWLVHRRCAHRTAPVVICGHCSEPLRARDMSYAHGPGANVSAEGLPEITPQDPA
jgi:DNA-binding HxlR family transcriptional regulator